MGSTDFIGLLLSCITNEYGVYALPLLPQGEPQQRLSQRLLADASGRQRGAGEAENTRVGTSATAAVCSITSTCKRSRSATSTH